MEHGILVIGSLNMDLSVTMKRMPEVGETVMGETLSYEPGGKGANQACAAGRLGGNTRMLGCVGRDEFGLRLCKSLEGSGVDGTRIKTVDGLSTGTAVISVNEKGDNSIVVVSGSNMACTEEYLRENDDLFQWCSLILLQMEIPAEAVLYGARRGRELGKKVILNPAPAPESISQELLSLVDVLTPNETELLKLSGLGTAGGKAAIEKGAERLLELGVGHVLVTLGEEGALLVNHHGKVYYPSQKVKAVDTTAAGDCFNGALAVALSEGMTMEQSISFANKAAALSVSRRGAQDSLPFYRELDW